MMHAGRVRKPVKRRKRRDRLEPMPAQVPVSSYLPYERYKAIVKEQLYRFSSSYGSDADSASDMALLKEEVSKIADINETRIKAAWERGIPSRRVAKSLMP